MIGRLRSPLLFVSYSRDDALLTEAICEVLRAAGFRLFVDREGTLIGEDFVHRLKAELGRCDGVVAIVTTGSGASEWCRGELHWAHALNKRIALVLVGTDLSALPQPLQLLLRGLNYVSVADAEAASAAGAEIVRSLREVRARWLRRTVASLAGMAVLIAVISALLVTLPSRINTWTRVGARGAAIERVLGAQTLLGRDAIASLVRDFASDDSLIAQLRLVEGDGERTDLQRFNAQVAAAALLDTRAKRDRRYLETVDWSSSELRNCEFTNLTIGQGNLSEVSFRRSTFSGVAWSSGPTSEAAGLTLGGVAFEDCLFYAGWFYGTSVVSTQFLNCRLKGTELDVSEFNDVVFESRPADPTGTVISTDYTGLISCVIKNCVEPSPEEPGVIRITPPKAGPRFVGVVFEDCALRGTLPAEWFLNCSFSNCVLPTTTTSEALEAGGNAVTGCTWFDPHCW